MTADPWLLTPIQKHKLMEAGVDVPGLESIEDARRERWEFVTGDPEFKDLQEHGYMYKYGIDHVCHCAEDVFLERMLNVTLCSQETAIKGFEALEATLVERDALREELDALKGQL